MPDSGAMCNSDDTSKSSILTGDRIERIDSPEVKRDSPRLRGTDLRAIAQSAVIWNTGFNLFRDLLQFVVMLVLVRLLDARAYGQFSLVTSIVGFISIFSFNNFIAYTLQVETEDETHYQEHFTAGAVLQIGMFLLTNFIAVCLRWIPAYSSTTPLLHVMSVTFLLEWPCELRRKMIERAFDWRRLRLVHAIGLSINAALAIILGWMGAGVYALLVPGMAVTWPFIYDLFVSAHWRPNWSWSWEKYKRAWNFGLTRIGSGLTLYGKQLLESGALAAVLGFSSLGILTRSIGLAQMFCQKFASQLMYAIYPILARSGAGSGAHIGSLIFRLVAWTVVPIAVCFAVLAGPVVGTVYGKKWLAVVPLLPWAMAWGVGASLSHAGYMLLLARQQQRRCLFADALFLCGTGVALALALPFGTRAYLMASAILQFLVLLMMVQWLFQLEALTSSGLVSAFLPTITASFLAAVAAVAMLRFLNLAPSTFVTAAGWGIIFALSYLLSLRLIFVRELSDLISYFPARKQMNRLFLLKKVQ